MTESTTAGFPMAELVARTGVPAATVRYYVALGIIPAPRRVAPNRFLYDERHVEIVGLVRALRERRHLGLDVIGRLLPPLLEASSGDVFKPEMWDQLVDDQMRTSEESAPAARLIEAGIAEFNRLGYAEVHVDDVCRVAHIAKGSFYRHFASKEELFFASATTACDRVVAELEARADSRVLGLTEATELLAMLVQPILVLILDLVAQTAQRRPGHGRVLGEVFDTIEAAVRRTLTIEAGDLSGEEILERALVVGMRRLVAGPLETELIHDQAGI